MCVFAGMGYKDELQVKFAGRRILLVMEIVDLAPFHNLCSYIEKHVDSVISIMMHNKSSQ